METIIERDRLLTSTPKDNSSPTDRLERKTLQTLQLSATGKNLNGGKNWGTQQKESTEGKKKTAHHEECSSSVKCASSPSSLVLKIYEDPLMSENMPLTRCTRLTQTDDSLFKDLLQESYQHISDINDSGRESEYIDPEAYDLMVKEEVTETYWKDIAEERRRALKESLEENEKLHSRLEILVEENKRLQEENARLSNIAAKAESLQELLQGIISNEDDDDDDTGILRTDKGD